MIYTIQSSWNNGSVSTNHTLNKNGTGCIHRMPIHTITTIRFQNATRIVFIIYLCINSEMLKSC